MVGWQEGHPSYTKNEWWGVGVVICLERGAYGPADATATHRWQRLPSCLIGK